MDTIRGIAGNARMNTAASYAVAAGLSNRSLDALINLT
jgi:hypothetical protein